MDKPRYEHDCTVCIYLGQHGTYDLYFCPNEPTIIARESSDGADYRSGIVFGLNEDHPLHEALKRALKNDEAREAIVGYFERFEHGFPQRREKFLKIYEEVMGNELAEQYLLIHANNGEVVEYEACEVLPFTPTELQNYMETRPNGENPVIVPVTVLKRLIR